MFLFAAACALLVAALAQVLAALAIRRAVPPLDALARSPAPARWPLLSIVVPARDEARELEAALRSKLSAGYPALQVVVVDDRSTDETPSILARMSIERFEGAELVHTRVELLPDGWLGKMNALQQGASVATGEWVLFADADVHVAPGTLERLVAHAEANGVDFIAVFPKMEPVGLWVDASLAGLLRALSLSGRIWRANDDRSSVGLGVGAFNLARREWLERTRAIEHLRMEIADDVALGAWLKQCGARTRFYAGRESVSLVFQDSLSAIMRSSDKGGGMFRWSLWLPAIAALSPIAVELALPAVAIARGGITAVVAVAALAGITATHALLSSHFAGPLRGAIAWPLSHLFNAVTILRAGWLAWRAQGIVWRGTFYPRAAVDAGKRLFPPSFRVAPLSEPAEDPRPRPSQPR